MEVIFDKEFLTIFLCSEHGYLRLDWRGRIAKDDYVDALEFCMKASRDHQINKILVDQRQILPLTPDEQNWLAKNWFPRFLDPLNGEAIISIISSPVTFRDLSSKSIAKRLADKYDSLKIRYFAEEAHAVQFIENPVDVF